MCKGYLFFPSLAWEDIRLFARNIHSLRKKQTTDTVNINYIDNACYISDFVCVSDLVDIMSVVKSRGVIGKVTTKREIEWTMGKREGSQGSGGSNHINFHC